jgi:Do/DeqQ family serine protease
MNRKIFSSPVFFVVNLLLVGVAAGMVLSVGLFSCTTSSAGTVSARDRDNLSRPSIDNLQESFREVAAIARPSVVRIDVEEIRTQAIPRGNDTPWFDFFFNEPDSDRPERDRQFRTQGLGSGVIVRQDQNLYYVLTNDHVVGNADQITITLDDGEEFSASIVGKDARKDLALLSFESAEPIPVAALGDSSSLHVGDWVLAIGSPFGFQSTVTAGIVSALDRRGGPEGNISDFIQTDAAINRGNSGGALVNLRGEVIGINTWITSQTGGSVGLGFSIPINNVIRAIDDFIESGTVRYGWLGVSIRSIGNEIAASMSLPNRRGALVHHVFTGSPADRGGLLPGDVVVEINGVTIQDSDQLVLVVGDLPVGRVARFVVLRDGETVTEEVRIAERESDQQIAELNRRLWPGFVVFPLSQDVRQELDLAASQRGVLVTSVENRTNAAQAGIRPGDVVTSINDTATPELREFYRALNGAGRRLRVTILREGTTREIQINQ